MSALTRVATEYSQFDPKSFYGGALDLARPQFTIGFRSCADFAAAVQHGTGKPYTGAGRYDARGSHRIHEEFARGEGSVLLRHACFPHLDCWEASR